MLSEGRFAEAKNAPALALKLLPPAHPLRNFAREQLTKCEIFLAVDQRLAAVLKGDIKPADVKEQLALAILRCRMQFGSYGETE